MSLTDVVSGWGVSGWQAAALVIFFIAFSAILIHALSRPRAQIRRWSHLPISDESEPGGHSRDGVSS